MRIEVKPTSYHKVKASNKQRLKAGIEKFREALEQDAKEDAERGSGLPTDWRNRIFKEVK